MKEYSVELKKTQIAPDHVLISLDSPWVDFNL